MDNRYVVPVASNGRMNLPSAIRAKLELEGGGRVVFVEKDNGEVEITSLRRSLRRAQELVRQYIPNGAGIVDELIADRRAQAAKEEAEDRQSSVPSVGRDG